MALITLKPALLTAVVALLSSNVRAFTSPVKPSIARSPAFAKKPFFMAEDENIDKVQLTSARKEVVFDDKTGRFFETSMETPECIPDEEYCQTDESTGDKIRLTMAEKERIFLDSLQVRRLVYQKWNALKMASEQTIHLFFLPSSLIT
jgi:hypothetical protein